MILCFTMLTGRKRKKYYDFLDSLISTTVSLLYRIRRQYVTTWLLKKELSVQKVLSHYLISSCMVCLDICRRSMSLP